MEHSLVFQPVPENLNKEFDSTKVIFSNENQSATVGYSAQLRANLQTTNDFVSPMIDDQRVSLCCISNRVDNLLETDVTLSPHDDRTAVNANTNVAFSATDSTITTTNSAQEHYSIHLILVSLSQQLVHQTQTIDRNIKLQISRMMVQLQLFQSHQHWY